MTIKKRYLALVPLVLMAFSTPSIAKGNSYPNGVEGVVQDVNTVNGTISVRQKSGIIQILKVLPKTTIYRDGHEVALSDIKTDDLVNVQYPGSNLNKK